MKNNFLKINLVIGLFLVTFLVFGKITYVSSNSWGSTNLEVAVPTATKVNTTSAGWDSTNKPVEDPFITNTNSGTNGWDSTNNNVLIPNTTTRSSTSTGWDSTNKDVRLPNAVISSSTSGTNGSIFIQSSTTKYIQPTITNTVRDTTENNTPPKTVAPVIKEEAQKVEINKEVEKNPFKISLVAASSTEVQIQKTINVIESFKSLPAEEVAQGRTRKTENVDLVYKDSNNDGISDYDSVHIYNIDPIKPSPISTLEDKKITAGEKVLLGFDPSKNDLVKIFPEEPQNSIAPQINTYKVENVSLNQDKKIEISGSALPNSFVTIYIYSTPIILTVKTNSDGEWNYTLDKELDDGKHTIYTATVANTGKILAKSNGFLFTKTAEAATLESVMPVQTSSNTSKPGIINIKSILIFLVLFLAIIAIVFILIGVNSRKRMLDSINSIDDQTPPVNPPQI